MTAPTTVKLYALWTETRSWSEAVSVYLSYREALGGLVAYAEACHGDDDPRLPPFPGWPADDAPIDEGYATQLQAIAEWCDQVLEGTDNRYCLEATDVQIADVRARLVDVEARGE